MKQAEKWTVTLCYYIFDQSINHNVFIKHNKNNSSWPLCCTNLAKKTNKYEQFWVTYLSATSKPFATKDGDDDNWLKTWIQVCSSNNNQTDSEHLDNSVNIK